MPAIRSLLSLLTILFLTLPGWSAPARPNVIILFADDLRSDMIHGNNRAVKTPNLDKLAASGTAFPHAYIMGGQGGAVCLASRAMLMTGQHLHSLIKNGKEIPTTATMMGEEFRKSGYYTYGIGKWHNGTDTFMRNFENGDEILFGGMTQSQWNIPLNHFRKDGKYTAQCMSDLVPDGDLPMVCDHFYKDRHSSEIFADAAISFLNDKPARGDRPFFLYLAFTAPHDPRDAPKEFLDMYPLDKIQLPPNFMPQHPFDNGHTGRDEKLLPTPRDPEAVKKEIRDYYAIISHLDSQVGRVLDAVTSSGLAENTIIVFAGDNGLAVGQHGLLGKQSVYEHSVNVPLIITGPDIAKGESVARVYLTEIFPTLCDLTGVARPSTVQVDSFTKCLRDPQIPYHDDMFFAFRDMHRGLNDGRYKLIEYEVGKDRHTQLFDLQADPWEKNNLAESPDQKDRVNAMRAKLKQYHTEHHDPSNFWKRFKPESGN